VAGSDYSKRFFIDRAACGMQMQAQMMEFKFIDRDLSEHRSPALRHSPDPQFDERSPGRLQTHFILETALTPRFS
jgi:hypothetical protein